jgi:hypothetical protein
MYTEIFMNSTITEKRGTKILPGSFIKQQDYFLENFHRLGAAQLFASKFGKSNKPHPSLMAVEVILMNGFSV